MEYHMTPKEAYEASMNGIKKSLEGEINDINQGILDRTTSGNFCLTYCNKNGLSLLKIKRLYEYLGFNVKLYTGGSEGSYLEISWSDANE